MAFDLFPRLEERKRQVAKTLSGGEQQMLAIGRGLMAAPKLMLIDEMSLGLAPIVVDEIFKVLEKIRTERHHGALRRAEREPDPPGGG